LISWFGAPLLLTPFFAGQLTAVARAELLAEPGAWIRFKPFFAAETLLEPMLILHRSIVIRVNPAIQSAQLIGGALFSRIPTVQ
jgi:hypothetical protein